MSNYNLGILITDNFKNIQEVENYIDSVYFTCRPFSGYDDTYDSFLNIEINFPFIKNPLTVVGNKQEGFMLHYMTVAGRTSIINAADKVVLFTTAKESLGSELHETVNNLLIKGKPFEIKY